MPRIICSFSCGAASAVATKLTLNNHPDAHCINIYVAEEHPDNRRFLKDCEKWFGKNIEILQSKKYEGSIYRVMLEQKYITGPRFTPCSKLLKKQVAEDFYDDTDEIVLGFTAEEEARANRFIDANNTRHVHLPLIDAGLTKADCLELVRRAGIEIPAMYRLGYDNANCIGCVRGGLRYWNKIRHDFPQQFEDMAKLEYEIGATVLRYRSGQRKNERMPLRDLPKMPIDTQQEPMPECSIFCEAADI